MSSALYAGIVIGLFAGLLVGSELARRAYKRTAELLNLSLAVAELKRELEMSDKDSA